MSILLVMSYIDGIQIDHIEELGSQMGMIGRRLPRKQHKTIVNRFLADGFFHADPHPGNLWISGGQIVWLDLGMAGDSIMNITVRS